MQGTGGRENVERNDHGDPWIVNVPIPYTVPKEQRPNADDLDSGVWRQKVVDGVLPYLHEFKADLVLMSAGFDAHKVRQIVGGCPCSWAGGPYP